MQPIQGALCSHCGERVVSRHLLANASGEVECGNCRQSAPLFEKAAAYGSYDAGMRDLIHLLKYEQVRPAAGVLGRMLAEVVVEMGRHFGPEPPMVVPVPLHSSRLRQRGFNHSELIAAAALKQMNSGRRLALNAGVLSRRRATESQTGLTSSQRRANVRGAFRVEKPATVSGCDVLLVDDVYTTGTTVSECTRVLGRRGRAGFGWRRLHAC